MSNTAALGSRNLVERAVVAACAALEAAQDELCRLDAAAGDGDEGLAMAAAARAIRKRLAERRPTGVAGIVAGVAAELSAVGGAMGAISYVLVSAIGDRLGEDEALDADRLADLLAAAEDAVSSFGGAVRGDKSIVDAIGFARDEAAVAARSRVSTTAAILAAAGAARSGADATAGMEARVGRAGRLGSRSLGTIDAGAQTFAIALGALAETYAAAAESREAT
jgi:D-erythrulose 4-kinase